MGEWREVTMGDVCEFRAGSVFKLQYQGQDAGDYPFIKVSDMNLPMNRVNIHGANNWINHSVADALKAQPLPPDTIVFAKIGEALKHNRLRMLVQATAIDNNMMGAIPSPRLVDPRFLYYAMHQFDFGELSSGTALPYLTVASLAELALRLPPLAEQRAIAHVLGTLDDKIELNRRMNETLEAMARALFKSWFVNFDPVRAKMQDRDTGLPPDVAALFPDRLVDSELGEIPEGWEVKALGDVASITRGRSYRRVDLSESNVALVTLKSFARGGGYQPDGLKPYSGPYKPEQIVESGDVVVSCTDVTQAGDVIGRSALVRRSPMYQTLVASLDCLILRPRPYTVTQVFLYLLGRSEQFAAYMYNHTTGTTVLHLAPNAVLGYLIALPSVPLVRAFTDLVIQMMRKIEMAELECENLAALRDALLPRLVSGEVRVRSTVERSGV